MTGFTASTSPVILIRRKLIRAVIEGEPGHWIWEVAVGGEPDAQTGMILSLPIIDAFQEDSERAVRENLKFEVDSASAWFLEQAQNAKQLLAANPNVHAKLVWQRLLSPTTEYAWRNPLE